MPEWVISINDVLFRFVTQGAAWPHVAAFLPLGLATGLLAAWWAAKLVARESEGTRRLSRRARGAVVLSTGALFTVLVVAVMRGQEGCQWVTEGGSINWGHWRLLYHYALITFLVVATTVDFDQYLIPDQITMPGVLVGFAVATALGNMQLMQIWIDWNHVDPIEGPYIPEWITLHPHWHGLAYSLAGLVTGAGITWLSRLISQWVLGMEALGFGDVTLMAMIGSFLGWQPVIFVFLLAPLCGIVGGISFRLLYGRIAVPYGPFLSAATVLVLLTWRWLWTPTREVFGHWPTLLGLGAGLIVGMAVLLGLLRLYRSIPVERRTADSGGQNGESRNV